MEYTYNIPQVKTETINNVENVITEIHWEVIGKQDGMVVITQDVIKYNITNTSSLTPFNDLTETQVWSWVFSQKPKTEIQETLNTLMQKRIISSEIKSLPFTQNNVEGQ